MKDSATPASGDQERAALSVGCVFVLGSPLLRHCPIKSRDSCKPAHSTTYSSGDSDEECAKQKGTAFSSWRRNKRGANNTKAKSDSRDKKCLPLTDKGKAMQAQTLEEEEEAATASKAKAKHGKRSTERDNLESSVQETKKSESSAKEIRKLEGAASSAFAVADDNVLQLNNPEPNCQEEGNGRISNSGDVESQRGTPLARKQSRRKKRALNGVDDDDGDDDEPEQDFVPPDGGWGWVVCVTSLWVNGCVMGTVTSFGILYDFIVREHAQDADASFKTSFIGSCLLGVMLLMCCVSGILCDIIGLRQTAFAGGILTVVGFTSSAFVTQLEHLYITYGVILGSGFGLLYSPLVAIAGHYFSRRLGLVNGIVTFGPSAFTMALSFALPAALREFGFRETLLGFAGFGFTIAIATLAWKPLVTGGRGGVRGKGGRREGKEGEEGCAEKKRKRWLGYVVSKVYAPELWSNKAFIVWCLAIAVARFGYMEPNFHLVNHVRSLFPSHNAPILVTIMAGTSGFSKLFFGLVSDFLRHHRISLQQGALLVYGVTQLLVPVCGQWTGFLLMAVCLGLSDALIMVLFGPNVVDLVGPARASQAFGFMSLLSIPGFLSAPAITGRLHDELNHYDAGFYLAGAVSVLAAVIMFCVTRPCLACCYVTADVTPTKEGNRGSTKTVPRGQTETAEQTSALCTSLQPFQHRPDSTPIPRVTAALTSNQRYGDLNLDDHHNRRMETPEGRSLRPELSSKCCTPRDSNAAHIRTLSGGLKDQDTCTRQTRATSRTSNNAHDLKPEDAGARNIIERDCLSMCDPSHHNDIQSQALDTDLPSTDMQLTNSDKQVKAHVTAQNERVLDLAKLPTRSQESDDESGFTESTHL